MGPSRQGPGRPARGSFIASRPLLHVAGLGTGAPIESRRLTASAGPADPPPIVERVSDDNDRIVWIDCEMTGLSLSADALVEIAVVVTDSELNCLDEGIDIVIKPPADALAQMGEVVTTMHTASGLITELDSGVSVEQAQEQVMTYLRQHVSAARKAPLAGNSVGTDRSFIARDMPELDDFLHYRIIDVSSIKELARRWYPRAYFQSPAKAGGHRALADILESIRELRYYRQTVMVAAPGPDSDAAKAVADALLAEQQG